MKKIILGLFAAIAFAGCTKEETVLSFGTSGEPGTLDPHKATGVWESAILGNVFLGLMTDGIDGVAVYGAAESHTVSDDGKTWTFKLRKSNWSDGKPVVAKDFEAGFKRIMNPEFNAEYAYILYVIKNAEQVKTGEMGLDQLGVKALDEKTVQIELNNKTPYFLALLKHFTAYPIPSHMDEAAEMWLKPGSMVVNGPYVITEWTPNTYLIGVKNQKFYDASNVKIDKVYFYPLEDRSTALKKFRAGELHFHDDIPVDQIDWIKQNLEGEFFTGPYLANYYYAINLKDPMLSSKDIRKALAMAIDRNVITEKITKTGDQPAYSFVPPLKGFKQSEMSFKKDGYMKNLADAKMIMEKAGYSKSKPMKLQLRYNSSENHKKIAIAVSAMWKAIYVETEFLTADVAVHYDEIEKHNFQVARAAWAMDYADPENLLSLISTGNNNNYSQYSNPEFDKYFNQAAELSGAARVEALAKAEQIINEDIPNIPIYFEAYKNLVSKKLKGYEPNAEDTHRIRFMSLSK